MDKKNINKLTINDSIDILEILSKIWINRKFIFISTISFTIISIIFSMSLNNNYKANSIFYPHIEKLNNSQSLKNLAGIAGFSINSQSTDNIPTTLYPNLINSPQFKTEILNDKIILNQNEISFREYLLKKKSQNSLKKIFKYPINYIKSYFSNKNLNLKGNNLNILELSVEENNLHNYLSNVIDLNLNKEEGFIDLSVIDEDPYVASQIAKTGTKILQKNIIDFKLKNINDTYKFINSQLKIAKNNFYSLQDSLAIFKDNNKNIKSDLFLNKFERIESEYIISKNIYNELAINKEKISIEVQKNTPIFTIIKPVVIPNDKYSPNRSLIILFGFLFGLVLSISYSLIKFEIYKFIKNFK